MQETIEIEIIVKAPIAKVWEYWTGLKHINGWAFASDDWEAKAEKNDLKVGGSFKTVMSAKDKSAAFDFTGMYTMVNEHELIEYDLDDGRHVKVEFKTIPGGVKIIETFEPEKENPIEMQRSGWLAILNNFKHYTEHQPDKIL